MTTWLDIFSPMDTVFFLVNIFCVILLKIRYLHAIGGIFVFRKFYLPNIYNTAFSKLSIIQLYYFPGINFSIFRSHLNDIDS